MGEGITIQSYMGIFTSMFRFQNKWKKMGILVVKNGVVKKRTKRCVLRLDLCTREKKKKKVTKRIH
jgi:hypothetical protein